MASPPASGGGSGLLEVATQRQLPPRVCVASDVRAVADEVEVADLAAGGRHVLGLVVAVPAGDPLAAVRKLALVDHLVIAGRLRVEQERRRVGERLETDMRERVLVERDVER